MATKIFNLESAAYMTAGNYQFNYVPKKLNRCKLGIMDVQKTKDIALEAACTKLIATDTAKFVVENCIALMGSRAYSEDAPIMHILRDMQVITLSVN